MNHFPTFSSRVSGWMLVILLEVSLCSTFFFFLFLKHLGTCSRWRLTHLSNFIFFLIFPLLGTSFLLHAYRAIIYTTYNTQSTEYYKSDISKYISFSINITLTEIPRTIYRICYFWMLLIVQLPCFGSEFQHNSMDCEFQYHSLFKQGLS